MKRYLSHFQYHWIKYILIIVLPIILWTSIFDILAEPADSERFRIYFIGEGLNCEDLSAHIENQIPFLTEQASRIREVSVSSSIVPDETASSVAMARSYDYDLIIIPESFMSKNIGQANFNALDTQLVDELLSSVTYYTEPFYEEERSYGMVLFDGQQNNVFSEYYNGTETCYVFFSSHSVNLGQLNTTGNTEDDVALTVLDYLLSEDL